MAFSRSFIYLALCIDVKLMISKEAIAGKHSPWNSWDGMTGHARGIGDEFMSPNISKFAEVLE